jgi:hypothetical protein
MSKHDKLERSQHQKRRRAPPRPAEGGAAAGVAMFPRSSANFCGYPGGRGSPRWGGEGAHTAGPATRIQESSETGRRASRARPLKSLVDDVRRLPDNPATKAAPSGASTASVARRCRGLQLWKHQSAHDFPLQLESPAGVHLLARQDPVDRIDFRNLSTGEDDLTESVRRRPAPPG